MAGAVLARFLIYARAHVVCVYAGAGTGCKYAVFGCF